MGAENLSSGFAMSVTDILKKDDHRAVGDRLVIFGDAASGQPRFKDHPNQRRQYRSECRQLEHDYPESPGRDDRHSSRHQINAAR